MGKQHIPERFRRCSTCGCKSHRRWWKNGICPVCHKASVWRGSTHGELSSEREIKKARKDWIEESRKRN